MGSIDFSLETLLAWLRKILDAGFPEEQFLRLVASDDTSDAVEIQTRGITEGASFTHRDISTRQGFVLFALGHIPASLSRPTVTRLLKEIYVYPNPQGMSEKFPNWSPKSPTPFLAELIRSSKIERRRLLGESTKLGNVFTLLGERGVGKTIFLNHMLIRFSEHLDREKVIWTRIHLTDEFGGVDPDIEHWLYVKLAYLVFRHYQDRIYFKPFLEDLKRSVRTHSSAEVRPALFAAIDDLKQVSRQPRPRVKANEGWLDKALGKYIVEWLTKKGFSMIYVLDGFDLVDNTGFQKTRLRNLVEQVHGLLSTKTGLGGCFLISMRKETRLFIGKQTFNSSQTGVNFKERELERVPFRKILTRRLEVIRRHVEQVADENHWETEDWPGHMGDFVKYINNLADERRFSRYVSRMDDVWQANHRAKLQVLRLLYHEFLVERKHPRRYRWIETVCRSGYKYPPAPFSYYTEGGQIRANPQTKLFDNIFLPPFFRPPWTAETAWSFSAGCRGRSPLLMGLRMIQLIRWWQRKIGERFVSCQELLDEGELLYGYHPRCVELLVEELAETGFLSIKGSGLLVPREFGSCQVAITPKADAVLGTGLVGSGGILTDIAYLNMCAMRAPIARDCLAQHEPYFRAATLEDGATPLTRWVAAKLINSAALLRLLQEIDRRETLNQEDAKVPERTIGQGRAEIEGQYRAVLTQMSEKERAEVGRLISAYLSEWLPGWES